MLKKLRETLQKLQLLRQSKNGKLLLVALLAMAIPLTVFVAGQIQDTRNRASELSATPVTPPLPEDAEGIAMFDGNSGYILLGPNFTAMQPLTTEVWVKPEAFSSGTRTIIATVDNPQGASCQSGFVIYVSRVSQDAVRYHLTTYDALTSYALFQNALNSSDASQFDKWTHVAFTVDVDRRVKFYIDGKLKDEKVMTEDMCDPKKGVVLGVRYSSTPFPLTYYKGAMDNVRISDSLRYTQNFSPAVAFVPDANTIMLHAFTGGKVTGGELFGTVWFVEGIVTNDITPTPTNTPTPTFDLTPPSVTITSPRGGSRVLANKRITIAASASDPSGIAKVEFLVEGRLRCTDAQAPYTCSWLVPRRKGVRITIQAKAYDVSGNIGTSVIKVTSR